MPAANLLPTQPDPKTAVIEPNTEIFAILWRNYFLALDRVFRTASLGPLPQAANDAAAKAAGVPVNGLYANGSQVMVRIT